MYGPDGIVNMTRYEVPTIFSPASTTQSTSVTTALALTTLMIDLSVELPFIPACRIFYGPILCYATKWVMDFFGSFPPLFL